MAENNRPIGSQRPEVTFRLSAGSKDRIEEYAAALQIPVGRLLEQMIETQLITYDVVVPQIKKIFMTEQQETAAYMREMGRGGK